MPPDDGTAGRDRPDADFHRLRASALQGRKPLGDGIEDLMCPWSVQSMLFCQVEVFSAPVKSYASAGVRPDVKGRAVQDVTWLARAEVLRLYEETWAKVERESAACQ
jgi:hypothetical protein